jgi:WD40 repeat protein
MWQRLTSARQRGAPLLLGCAMLVSLAVVMSFPLVGWAGEHEDTALEGPPREPFLRVETGMHTAGIMGLGIDAENRYLVTASQDKTTRVWELITGRLLKILRPPIGIGWEGKLYAVALSPDGRTVATGGWTGWEWEKVYSIYLFDRESGRLIHRISELPDGVGDLAYAKDGQFLVATLAGKSGIRLYRTSDYSLVGEDNDYGDQSLGADFDHQGRLVTPCLDGFLRLYEVKAIPEPSLQLVAKQKVPGGHQPFSVSFSPDGSKIAVGFADSTRVDILSGKDLSHLYSPDTSSVEQNLSRVSWSADGRFLYAGGWYSVKDIRHIRKWADGGQGGYQDLPAARNTIMYILPRKEGGIAFAAGDPVFGIFDAENKREVRESSIADYRASSQGFLISADGAEIQFGYEPLGRSPARFSITSRLLELEPSKGSALTPPVTAAEGLTITDWRNTYTPKLNDKALSLAPHETSRSLAISPDSNTLLLGTEWWLRLFDREGREQWRIPIPGAAWGVNISGSGKVAVAALGDGTIRWYRMSDGKELLAFFPHNDKKRWVLWTPTGYYDASPGGEDLIGWHLNNGKDAAADFFPASRLRARYYRPDVVAKVLETQDEGEALRLAEAEAGQKRPQAEVRKILPPVVEIISPRDGAEISSPEVKVQFTVRSPSGELATAVKALVDGRPVRTERGVAAVKEVMEGTVQALQVTVPERDVELSLIVENRYAASVPATVHLKWRGEGTQEEFVLPPKLYVLAIGVNTYQDETLTLKFAAKDARDFAAAMARQKGGLYRDVVVKVLTDEQATKDALLDGLDWLEKETTSRDVAIVFLAGHGVNDANGLYYFLPVNADTGKLKRTAVPFSDLKNTVASLAGKAVLFVDTCHSGNVMGARRGVADIAAVVNELSSAENGAVVFASSTGRQYSLEDPAWDNGAFTKALVEGVNGGADYRGTGKITVNMLDVYVSERVKELTRGRQTPTTTKPQTVADFPIAIKR